MQAVIDSIIALCNGSVDTVELFKEMYRRGDIKAMCLVSKFLPSNYKEIFARQIGSIRELSMPVAVPDFYLRNKVFQEPNMEMFDYLFLGNKRGHIQIFDDDMHKSALERSNPDVEVIKKIKGISSGPCSFYIKIKDVKITAKYVELMEESTVDPKAPIYMNGVLHFNVEDLRDWACARS
jgi:hypothetical protein